VSLVFSHVDQVGNFRRQLTPVRHACIRRHEGAYAVALMCRVLRVSRAGYYAWRRRATPARVVADAALTTAIAAVHTRDRDPLGDRCAAS
jgi:hypothetical protein